VILLTSGRSLGSRRFRRWLKIVGAVVGVILLVIILVPVEDVHTKGLI
jgi:hypothetical protein